MWGLWDTKPFPFNNRVKQLKELGYDSKVYGKDEVEALVERYNAEHNNKLSEAYYSIERRVGRADIGRYLIVFYHGGLYLDNDAILQRKLTRKEWKNEKGIWFTEKVLPPHKMHRLGKREAKIAHRISNYAFGSHKPENTALKEIIDESVKRVLSVTKPWTDKDVYYCTGPDIISTLYHRKRKLFSRALPKRIVRHTAEGSWKKQKDI